MNASGQKPEISILLPVCNEAMQIESCIKEVEVAIGRLSYSYEIIVSEDGSSDGTDVVVENLLRTDPRIGLLHSNVRLGKGKAIKNALQRAKGDIIIFMDADLATSLNYLPKALQLVREQGGLVIASRHVPGSIVRRRASRTFFSLAYNLLVRSLFLDGVHDHQCGFKAISHKAARTVLETKSNGFFFDTEMILRCKKYGFSVVEIGVEWAETRGKGQSKVKLLSDAQRIGMELLTYRFKS